MIDTLQIAKNDLRQGWETPNGATCACCQQKVKLYKRSLYAAPLTALIKLYRLNKKAPRHYHMTEIGTPKSGGGDFSKLIYWGFIEAQEGNDNPDTRTSGFWSITPLGRSFVRNEVAVPKSKFIYNNRVYGDSDEMVKISEVRSRGFNYQELIGKLL